MIEEDEDIVFGNSPLDEYLQEVTPLSFAKYSHVDTKHMHVNTKKEDENNFNLSKLSSLISKFQRKEILKSCQILLQSSCLTTDDEGLLLDLKDEVVQSLKEISYDKHAKYLGFLRKKYIWYSLIAFVLSSMFSYLTNFEKRERALAFSFFLVALSVCTWFCYKRFFSFSDKTFGITLKLNDVLNNYDKLLDKVIMHLKEVEVINHGYVKFKFDVANSCSKDSARSRKCLKLRNNVMNGLTDIFMKIRTNQRALLQDTSKDCPFDYKEEYIAFMSLDAFSEILNIPSSPMDSISLEYIPLEQIKCMVTCYRCLVSEFIYKVTVSLYYASQTTNSEEIIQGVLYSIEDVHNNLIIIYDTLKNYLDSSIKLIYQSEENHQPHVLFQEKTFESLLHSVEINLHVALARVDDMKNVCLTRQQVAGSFEDLDVFKNLLMQYNLSVDNSKTCMEDAVEHVLPSQPKQVIVSPSYDESDNSKDKLYVKFTQSTEPEGDALFEGESEAHVKNSELNCNIEDMEKQLKESRESRKLMKELKTILSVKDTPIGLLSFPLQKGDKNEVESDSDEEFMCGEQANLVDAESKKLFCNKYSYDYDPHGNSDNENIATENDVYEERMRIGLPISFLQNLPSKSDVIEETFGSTDEEDSLD